MEKRVFCLWMILALLCSALAVPAFAEGGMKNVDIPDKGITVTVPEEYITFTLYDAELDPRLVELGIPRRELENMLTNGNVMLILDPELWWSINVLVSDAPYDFSFDGESDDFIRSANGDIGSSYASLGLKVTRSDIARLDGKVFIRIWVDSPANPNDHMLQYLRVEDKQNIIFTLTRYDSEITSADEEILDTILFGSRLGQYSAGTAGSGSVPSAAGEYHDAVTGLSFRIPDGWHEEPLSQERQFVKMKMAPDAPDALVSIAFSNGDLFGQFTQADLISLGIANRSDVDRLLSADFVAGAYGVDPSAVRMEYHSGILFALYSTDQPTDFGLALPTVTAVTIHNGYMVLFQMTSLEGDYTDSLNAVLDSIRED